MTVVLATTTTTRRTRSIRLTSCNPRAWDPPARAETLTWTRVGTTCPPK